MFYFGLGKANY